jgi:hypothetical protein
MAETVGRRLHDPLVGRQVYGFLPENWESRFETVPEGFCSKCCTTASAERVDDRFGRALRYICCSCGAEWGPPDVTMAFRVVVLPVSEQALLLT